MINHLAATICRPDVKAQPTLEQIFAHVRGYLTFLGPDKDPYRVIKGPNGTISANKLNIVTPEKDKDGKNKKIIQCTRCWYKGHRWNVCKATRCNVCKTSLTTDAKFCPNWENHAEPGTKWIHSSNKSRTNQQPELLVAVKNLTLMMTSWLRHIRHSSKHESF
jgi:hypothetical protein